MKIPVLILILFFLVLVCSDSFGQSDSIHIETEIIDFNENSYFKHKYNYLDIALKDENKLLKIGIQPFKPNDQFDFSVLILHAGYESKVARSFSIVNEVNSTMTWYKGKSTHLTGYSLGVRYYYLKANQLKEKTSGNNCNGPYLQCISRDLLSLQTERIKIKNNKYLDRNIDLSFKLEVGAGIQQRLNRKLYFDANVWANYPLHYGEKITYGMTVLFGGAIGFWNE